LLTSLAAACLLLSWPVLISTLAIVVVVFVVKTAGAPHTWRELPDLYVMGGAIAGAMVIHAARFSVATRRARASILRTRSLERARHDLEVETSVVRALDLVSSRLIALLDTPSILGELCRLTSRTLGCDRTYVVFWRDDRYVDLVSGDGDADEAGTEVVHGLRIPHGQLEAALGLKDRDTLVAADWEVVRPFLEPAVEVRHACERVCGLRLRRGDTTVGALILCYADAAHDLTRETQGIAAGIAHLASLALHNAYLVERLREEARARDDFLMMVSHELRTPLTSISGFTSLLLEGDFGPLRPEQQAILERIDRQEQALGGLIDQMLDLSALKEGRVPLKLAPVACDEVIESVIGDFRLLAREKGVALRTELPPQLPPITTDASKLSAVLRTLLDNALKFTRAGAVTVSAEFRDQGVECAVADTGVGIEASELRRIFDPFFQADRGRMRRFNGAGLGLPVARRLLYLMSGSLQVRSEVGVGSTFRVWIPDREIPAIAPVTT
jgi:signal transduction histidine kinase